jgi:hypothetical protein
MHAYVYICIYIHALHTDRAVSKQDVRLCTLKTSSRKRHEARAVYSTCSCTQYTIYLRMHARAYVRGNFACFCLSFVTRNRAQSIIYRQIHAFVPSVSGCIISGAGFSCMHSHMELALHSDIVTLSRKSMSIVARTVHVSIRIIK